MSSSTGDNYIGKIVSLISISNIRYEGTIQAIDNDKITLKGGRLFHLEWTNSAHFRNGGSPMRCADWNAERDSTPHFLQPNGYQFYPYYPQREYLFRGIYSQYSFFDPSIVSGGEELAVLFSLELDGQREPQTMPPPRRAPIVWIRKFLLMHSMITNRVRNALKDNILEYVHAIPSSSSGSYEQKNNPRGRQAEAEEPISNDFDFEEANKLFEKDEEAQETAAPAYKKDDFFDSLQSSKDKYELLEFSHCLYIGREKMVAATTQRIPKHLDKNH